MKAVLFLVAMTFAGSSFAAFPGFVKGDDGQQVPIKVGVPVAGEIVKVTNLCPVNAYCITDGTIIDIAFELTDSCKQLKKPVTATVNEDTMKDVSINAQILTDALSLPTGFNSSTDLLYCAQQVTTEVVTLTLPMVYPPFTLSFEGTDVVVDVPNYTEVR